MSATEETILERWQRLDACMEALRVTKALRRAVHALQVIHGTGGPAGEMAGEAILLVMEDLKSAADPDATGASRRNEAL